MTTIQTFYKHKRTGGIICRVKIIDLGETRHEWLELKVAEDALEVTPFDQYRLKDFEPLGALEAVKLKWPRAFPLPSESVITNN